MFCDNCGVILGPSDYHPGPSVAALMKLSFDEEHRHAVCTLGNNELLLAFTFLYLRCMCVFFYSVLLHAYVLVAL